MNNSKSSKIKDLEWAIGLNRISLSVFGIWPGIPTGLKFKRKYLRLILQIMLMTITIFIPQFLAMYQVRHEFPLVLDNVITNTTAMLSALKLFVFWLRQKDLVMVLISMAAEWRDSRCEFNRKMMVEEAQHGRSMTITVFSLMFGNFCFYIICPIFGLSYRVISNITDYEDRLLIVQSYYPYDYHKTPYYQLTYVSQVFGALSAMMALTTIDTFFLVLVFHICGQLRVLSKKIRGLPEQDFRMGPKAAKDFSNRLGEIVDKHVHIIGLVKRIENLYTLLILLQVITMSAVTCCIGFGIVNALNNSEGMEILQLTFLVGSLSTAIVHIYIYCVSSEHLMAKSLEVYHSVYSGPWYFLPSKQMPALIPIMVRSQAPMRITAGKFMYMSLQTFATIVKSIVGYISVLIAINQ